MWLPLPSPCYRSPCYATPSHWAAFREQALRGGLATAHALAEEYAAHAMRAGEALRRLLVRAGPRHRPYSLWLYFVLAIAMAVLTRCVRGCGRRRGRPPCAQCRAGAAAAAAAGWW